MRDRALEREIHRVVTHNEADMHTIRTQRIVVKMVML